MTFIRHSVIVITQRVISAIKEDTMSEKEKEIAAQLAELPPDVQDKFLLMAQGAAMAVEAAKAAEAKDDTGDADE